MYHRVLTAMLLSMLIAVSPTFAADNNQSPTFTGWLNAFKKEARIKGISDATLNAALDDVQLLPRVIELDRNQPEFKLSFAEYYRRVANAKRIEKGQAMLKKHHELLREIEKAYGVQPRFIVALWGMETDFGRLTGGFRIVDALVTLAFDGRRSSFFRRELIEALRIIDAGHTTADGMIGSWAGAMGQTQFMPSTFTGNAVDFDGDSKINVWDSTADALASGANYLAKSGWNHTQTWGQEVALPDNFNSLQLGLGVRKTVAEWTGLGVMKINGSSLGKSNLRASVIELEGEPNRYFIIYDNYRAILKWNRSTHFATTVGLLADAIAGKRVD